MQKHWAKQDGTFIGTFLGARPDDPQAIEVPSPPKRDGQKWNGTQWVDTTQSLLEYNKRKRKEAEAKGTHLQDGTPLQTSNKDQAKVTAAIKYLESSTKFSTVDFAIDESNFITVDLPTLVAIGTAIGDYVQSLFTKQASVVTKIQSGAITTREQIDAEWSSV